MNAFFSSTNQAVYNLVMDARDGFSNVFSLQHRGFWFRLPFTKLSFWFEWRDCNVGYGWQKHDTPDLELFAGRLNCIISIER